MFTVTDCKSQSLRWPFLDFKEQHWEEVASDKSTRPQQNQISKRNTNWLNRFVYKRHTKTTFVQQVLLKTTVLLE